MFNGIGISANRIPWASVKYSEMQSRNLTFSFSSGEAPHDDYYFYVAVNPSIPETHADASSTGWFSVGRVS